MRIAKALGRNAGRRDALGYQKIRHVGGPPRRQHQIVGNALLLQRGSDRQIVGVPVDDDFRGRRETFQLRDNVFGELGLTGGAKPVTALREQQVTGFDKPLFCLRRRDLRLEICCSPLPPSRIAVPTRRPTAAA